MTTSFELNAVVRNETGTSASRRLRRIEQIPAILYGANEAPQMLLVDHNRLRKVLEQEAFYSSVFTVNIAGTKVQAVLKDLQRHPFKPKILHADFLRIDANEKLVMRVPLHFIGADMAPGVKTSGGIVSHLLTEIEIQCLPAHLPEYINVDLSQLQLDQSIHLSDIKMPEGVVCVAIAQGGAEHDLPVASIHMLRAEAESVAAAAGTTTSDSSAKK